MDVFSLLELAQARAIFNKLKPTEASVWRGVMREYSRSFSTPLHEVIKLDPEVVLLNLYEYQFDALDLEEDADFNRLMDTLHKLEDPDYDANHDKEEEEYNKKAVLEEEERLKKKALKKKVPVEDKPKELPKAGGINLGYLANNPKDEG